MEWGREQPTMAEGEKQLALIERAAPLSPVVPPSSVSLRTSFSSATLAIHPSSRPQSRTTESKVTGRKEGKEQKFRQGLTRGGGGEIDTTCCCRRRRRQQRHARDARVTAGRDVAFSQTCDRLLHMDYLLRLPPSCEGYKRPDRPDRSLHRPEA